MSFEERFREEFKSDAETILEDNLDRARGLFKYHDDGSIRVSDGVHSANGEIQVLVYLIAKRMMYEANEVENPRLSYDFFYDKLDMTDGSIRKSVQRLRDDSLAFSDDGDHEVVVENLPRAFDKIEETID